ncbi:5'-nucleotidase C-terminal domain-containing protein [Mumia sp. ZJ430]|uniref:bifunctional metallophosphatase/5'-nucleotidase n=1 Tax=Mumia sp. ZJ430 TaxID=2708083 RepID=UPI001422FFAE|nr:5'-nucleotidase C-terminal domain-containing protein [Mumia sp. ZJ430]
MPAVTPRLTVLATTDLHGQVRDHDYGTDRPYEDAYGNRIGLARVAGVVRRLRESIPTALLVDAGDVLEGSALSHEYARLLAEAADDDVPLHPMAAAMNHLGYDAVALGNHELDYGVRALARFREQLDAPLLAGNAHDAVTGEPALAASVMREVVVIPGEPPVRVGIVGLTTPKVTSWNRDVRAHLRFTDVVDAAGPLVAEVRAAGADVVVAVVHSGIVEPSTPENAALDLARCVPGVDVVVAGHAHVEVAERHVTGPDGRPVLLTEPLCWGMRVAVVEIDLARTADGWAAHEARSRLVDTADAEEDPEIVALVAPQHAHVRACGDRVVGHAEAPIETEPARYRPTTALALVAAAQSGALRGMLPGDLPLLSLVSPTNRYARVPAGPVRQRHVAALCQFDSGLVVVAMTGAELRAHLEHAAAFFAATQAPGPHHPDALTNAPTPRTPHGTPDFDYDVAYGAEAPLTYDIDLARPLGARIAALSYDGRPLRDAQHFHVVVSRYRASGAASYPHVSGAPVVHELTEPLRTLVARHLADGRPYAQEPHWRLLHDGQPLAVLDLPLLG